jgi:drug/metabolite transporter (DMT)-like permease
MLAIVLAVAAAIAFGASDYTAGLATRAANVFRVSVAAQVTSLVLTLLIAPWAGSMHLTAASAGWGALAGVAGDFGAVTLYLGFRHAAFSVASTISAVGSAALSVAAGLAFGERPTVLALAGIALALPAIAGVSASAGAAEADGEAPSSEAKALRTHTGRHLAGVGYGLLAGGGFALYFVGLNRAGSGSGLWPVVVGQAAGLLILLIVAVVTREAGPPPPGSRSLSVATGVTGTAGALLFFIGSHSGLLAITAVITSLYPAGTILLARVALGERLNRTRLLGLVLAGASVALIAVAGA